MERNLFPTLYKMSKKGVITIWRVFADGATVTTEWGQLGGALQSNSYVAEAKNVGRANATSPEAQASLEAIALFNKRLERQGYWMSPAEALQAVQEDGDDAWKPMKAQGGTEADVIKLVKFPAYGQTKHDGFRCKAMWRGAKLVFLSARGVEFEKLPFNMIAEAERILSRGNDKLILDGELEIAGEHRQVTQRAINGDDPQGRLRFVCYDVHGPELASATFETREQVLRNLIEMSQAETILYSPVTLLKDMAAAKAFFANSGVQKQEGVIIRNANGVYEPGRRSRNVVKWKHWQDAEYEIVDVISAGKSHEGLAMFVCETATGVPFDVTPEASHAERVALLGNRDKLIGKKITVKFQNFSAAGVPQHATAIDIRPDWDV